MPAWCSRMGQRSTSTDDSAPRLARRVSDRRRRAYREPGHCGKRFCRNQRIPIAARRSPRVWGWCWPVDTCRCCRIGGISGPYIDSTRTGGRADGVASLRGPCRCRSAARLKLSCSVMSVAVLPVVVAASTVRISHGMAHGPAQTLCDALMAYLTQRIRADKPVRLCLADDLGGRLDGAWWPYTGALADELAGLVTVLEDRLGKIVSVELNWSPLHNPPNLNWRDWRTKPQHIMTIRGSDASATLLIVPSTTNSSLAGMVLRRAASQAVDLRRGEEAMLQTAEEILTAARRQRVSGKILD